MIHLRTYMVKLANTAFVSKIKGSFLLYCFIKDDRGLVC